MYSRQECQFDGFTVPLIASATVEPNQTYHIKFIISDVADGSISSALFIKGSSFNAGGGTVSSTVSTANGSSSAVEGCNNAIVTFNRQNRYTSLHQFAITLMRLPYQEILWVVLGQVT